MESWNHGIKTKAKQKENSTGNEIYSTTRHGGLGITKKKEQKSTNENKGNRKIQEGRRPFRIHRRTIRNKTETYTEVNTAEAKQYKKSRGQKLKSLQEVERTEVTI